MSETVTKLFPFKSEAAMVNKEPFDWFICIGVTFVVWGLQKATINNCSCTSGLQY